MKFIHTSDWHIGQELFGYDRSDEHRYFLEQLCEIVKSEKPDALLVSGDIYHNAMPSSSATKLYTEEMVKLHQSCESMRIYVTAGNHDSYNRLESTSDLWKLAKTEVVGNIPKNKETKEIEYEKIVFDADGKGYIIALPYFNAQNTDIYLEAQKYTEKINKDNRPVIMMGHTTVANADYTGHKIENIIGGLEVVDVTNMGQYYDYMALGHIHCPQTLKYERAVRYSGSPVQVNFDENYPHTITIVEIDHHDTKPEIKTVEIKQKMKFYTIPKEPAEFDKALESLQNFNPSTPGYIRLNIKVKDYAPSDAQMRIDTIMAEKEDIRFCYIHTTKEETEKVTRHKQYNTQEIREMNPVELAQQYYKEKHNIDLEEKYVAMLKEITDEITINA